jgi:dinuclear metal center YbgI/SA1388 family protein
MKLAELEDYTGKLLEIARFHDYCPNGLQVEGRPDVQRLVSGVTASLALLERAVEADADAVLVHHGYFWKNEDPRLIGAKRKRLQLLLARGINLLAYHLPLDAHPVLGNNAQIAAELGFEVEGWFGEHNVACYGTLPEPVSLAQLCGRVAERLDREPLAIGEGSRPVRRIAWCSGAAQGYFEQALGLGVDAYLTGEISEHNVHLSRESGVAFIAAGHHATERYGVRALGAHLAATFGIEHRFIDVPNPV